MNICVQHLVRDAIVSKHIIINRRAGGNGTAKKAENSVQEVRT
jgi:hypothetical protein